MQTNMGSNKHFNVGDKVVNLRYLHLWNDPFFHIQFLNDAVHVVLMANSKHFTFNPLVKLPLAIVPEDYISQHIFSQDTGVCVVDNSKSVLSIERQSETIREILSNALLAAIKTVNEEFDNMQPEYSPANIREIHDNNKKKFAKITFLHTRFEEVVKVIFAK